ncbi:MAG: CPBP family intramembrane metalloprotease [Bacteroidaceae bacterium]|nr:CPBP family intramembrane metalloprotease [Bacteroidaceae bacterium]
MKKALLAVLVFCIMQALVSIILMVPMLILNLKSDEPAMFTFMGLALIISGLLTFLICWKGLKVIEFPKTFSCSDISWKWALVAIIASIMGVFAGDLLSEIANLPNIIEDMILGMATNIWGILAVAVIGPIVEELVFREGICGYLMRNDSRPWRAIWISAILFGIIHFNPAQVPFAILMGVILGVIYVKTGNIVVTSIIHILNNSIAVIQVNALGEKALDFSMVEWIGGPIVAGVCIIVGFTGCAYLLRKLWESSLSPTLPLEEGEQPDIKSESPLYGDTIVKGEE